MIFKVSFKYLSPSLASYIDRSEKNDVVNSEILDDILIKKERIRIKIIVDYARGGKVRVPVILTKLNDDQLKVSIDIITISSVFIIMALLFTLIPLYLGVSRVILPFLLGITILFIIELFVTISQVKKKLKQLEDTL